MPCGLSCGGLLAKDGGETSSSGDSGADVGEYEGGTGVARFSCPAGKPRCEDTDSGTCMAVLASRLWQEPSDLALDAENVYWTEPGGGGRRLVGSVKKTSKCGGPVVTLVSGRGQSTHLAVDATSVYWTDQDSEPAGSGPPLVMTVSLEGGTPETLATVPPGNVPCGIAVDASSVYWVTQPTVGVAPQDPFSAFALMGAPLDGGAPTQLAYEPVPDGSAVVPRCGVAVDAASIYWTSNAAVLKVSRNGGTVTTLASAQPYPTALAVDANRVYWTTGRAGSPGDYVMSVPLNGGRLTTLASKQLGPMGIAVDGESVYWTTWGGDPPAIVKVAVGGGAPVTLAETWNDPMAIAVDATHVYWVDSSGGNAMVNNPDGSLRALTPK